LVISARAKLKGEIETVDSINGMIKMVDQIDETELKALV